MPGHCGLLPQPPGDLDLVCVAFVPLLDLLAGPAPPLEFIGRQLFCPRLLGFAPDEAIG